MQSLIKSFPQLVNPLKRKIETTGNQVIQQGVWTSRASTNLLLRIPPRCGSLTTDVWELEAARSFESAVHFTEEKVGRLPCCF